MVGMGRLFVMVAVVVGDFVTMKYEKLINTRP